MEFREVFNEEDTFRHYHTLSKDLITEEQFVSWKESPMTKALFKILDYYCITLSAEYKNTEGAILHIIGKFNIIDGILERRNNK